MRSIDPTKTQLIAVALASAYRLGPTAAAQSELADYVDPTIGGVAWFLQPTYPHVHQPNQMLRTFPIFVGDLIDQIKSFPLQILRHRGAGVMLMRAVGRAR